MCVVTNLILFIGKKIMDLNQADGYSEPERKTDSIELAILLSDGMSVRTIKERIESDGYEVVEILDLLRCIIIRVQPEQMNTLKRLGETWNQITVKKPNIAFFD
jgi:hypothetical protein